VFSVLAHLPGPQEEPRATVADRVEVAPREGVEQVPRVPRLDDGMDVRRVEVGDVRLYVLEEGSGTPLVRPSQRPRYPARIRDTSQRGNQPHQLYRYRSDPRQIVDSRIDGAKPMSKRRVNEGICEVDCIDGPQAAAARAALPPEEESRAVAEAVKVLGHPGRLRVLKALEGRELCVCDLAHVLSTSMSATSAQLKELRRLGAVAFRTQGKLAYYRIADSFWLELADFVSEKLNGADTS
jgi:DNA-binding transcriptional ArsR family regulator